MILAYACVLIAALLPYIWVTVAKSGGRKYDNRDPRAWLATQDDGRVRRGNNAQLNAFEAFPAFAASVLMAQFAHVDARHVGWLAAAFVVFRVLHGLFYLANNHRVRSLVGFGGFICVMVLMGMAIAHIGAAA